MARWRGAGIGTVAIAVLLLVIFGGRLIDLYVDYLWFESVEYLQVFSTVLWSRVLLFGVGGVLFLAIFVPNLLWALASGRRLIDRAPVRFTPPPERETPFGSMFGGGGRSWSPGEERPRPFADLASMMGGGVAARWLFGGAGTLLVWLAATVLALILGLAAAGQWEIVLRMLNRGAFGTVDPIFGNDISFYVFVLPFLDFVQSWFFWVVALVLVGAGALYFLALYAVDPSMDYAGMYLIRQARGMRTHLLWLGALLLLVIAAGQWIGMYDVLTSRHERLIGANFTDVHTRIPAMQATIAALVLTALLTVATAFRRDYWLPILGGTLVLAIVFVGRGILPLLVQRLQVEPAELDRERPYIEHSINFTRQAFDLHRIEEQTFPAAEAVRAEEIRANSETITSIRLWDHRLLRDTLNQVQSIRPYYVFDDVDVDRYVVDGQYRQVMLSARELNPARLGSQAQTWVNRRLQYTHGYGVAMVPVNDISPEGLPVLFIRDLPPAGRIPVTRPEIYYGEVTDYYVIVNTGLEEFDFPSGDQSQFTTYEGDGGVTVGPIWRRLALSWFLTDFNLLVSGYVRSDSRVLFRRTVRERAQRIAPFLKLDRDPYLVIANGELVWMIDAYTTTDRYPYAQSVVERLAPGGAPGAVATSPAVGTGSPPGAAAAQPILGRRYRYNYVRNSAKITVSAYDGTVRVYLADPEDPIARSYARIFPGLIQPLEEMPSALRAHLRYPEDLFRTQAEVLRAFHVQDPQVFYNAEDVWSLAFESSAGQRQTVEPYYLIVRLPGEQSAEFVLVMPFTPVRRDNMTAWLAARMDGPNYGGLKLYRFPRDRLVFGPAQIASRIDQDTVISAQLTLWNQQGSRVERGNLLVIPIGNSTLYVQPIYLLAERSQLPELKQVIVATGNRIVMASTLEEGLLRLFGAEAGISAPVPPGAPGVPAPPGVPIAPGAPVADETLVAAARDARAAYQRSLDALRAGDFATFGDELRRLEQHLADLERQTASR
jgi:uncharacterized protein